MQKEITKIETRTLDLTSKAGALLRSRYGIWVLGIISFVESALVIPIITDPFMVAYIMAHQGKAMQAVLVTTATSIFGGVVAYITAAFFIDILLSYLSPETTVHFNEMVLEVQRGAFILAFMGAVTPVPFTLVAIAAGAIKANLLLFILGALVGRLLRYGIVGYLTYHYGHEALRLARKHIIILSVITFALVIWWILSL